MVIRLFLSAVSPDDVDEVERLFREDVIPAFDAHPDCLAAELIVDLQARVDGMVVGGALTRWVSEEAMEAALESGDLNAAQERIRQYLRREPLRQVYQVLA